MAGFCNAHMFLSQERIARDILASYARRHPPQPDPCAYEDADEVVLRLVKEAALATFTDYVVPSRVLGGESATERFEKRLAKLTVERAKADPGFRKEVEKALAQHRRGEEPTTEKRVIMRDGGGRYTEKIVNSDGSIRGGSHFGS